METEKFELMLDEAQANAALEKGMLYADTFVNKNYLINLDRYPLVELDSAEKSDEYIRLYQIERIVYDVDENANDKLISVYSAFFNIQAAGLLVIKSTRNALGFYIGVRSVDNTSTAEAILEKSFKGNFAGSQIQAIPQEEVQKVLGSINKSGRFGTRQNVSSVSIVPSTRDEDKERFVQGIEKFIDTMKGSEYTAVFIAEPLDKEILEQRKRGLQKIYSGLSPFASTQLSYGENYSKAVSKGMSENFSKTLNDSLTDTTSHFNSRSTSRSHGTSFGFLGIGFNNSTSTGYSSGSSWASAVTRGTSETKGETVTETDTDTTGDSRTITVTSENKSVKYILEKIDQHLARIKNCEAFGLWDIACYFVSENVQTSVVAASTYKALMAGFDSGVENSYVNVWKQDNTENTPALLEYLRYCIHPRFSIPGDDQFFEVESQTVNPCSLISGNEMPYIMGLPHHSVPGVTVLNMAEFGRNVRFSSGAPRGKKVELGQVYHMGEKETARVKLNLESFRSHCFITGSTGSGKSNTTYRILDEMIEHKIPFLVVEPAKGEYKRYYGKLPGIHVYCTNPRYYSMLHINPFRFNQGIHVLEHLDRLIEIFNACWPLYAAMPAILKESFERAYIKCGWDLENSIYIPNGHSKFPTFNDVLEALPEIINSSSYSSDSKGDYTGALVTRVKSLTNGISGQVLCSVNDIDEEYLFDQNTIVDLSRVSSLETKSLLMGVLILKLNEYRMCTSEENQPLAVGFYVVASAIHLVFHECGHFFGGLVSKYKLLFFRFGPFNLVKTEKTKIKFTWLKTHGGQCVMYPSQTSTIKYKAYNLGGVIANAIIAALSTLLMLPNNFYLLMMMIELVFVGAYKILVNLIPHKTNGVPNDGYIVKMLDAHIAMRKDYALYLRIYADTFLNKAISPSDYQYERNESLSDDELLYYNEIQEILKSINAQMSKHEIDHCKGIVI